MEARKILTDLTTTAKTQYIPSYIFAMLYTALGERDRAFARLNQGFQERDPYLVRLRVDEVVDPLRSDPRFLDLLARVGLSTLQRSDDPTNRSR